MIAGLMALVLATGCGSKPEATNVETSDRDKTQVDTSAAAYICPMNCENSASDQPGKCKVCGMDLEPKK